MLTLISTAYGELYDQPRLVDDLMLTYNRNVRTVANRSDVVVVDFWFFLSAVLDMVSMFVTLI